MATSKWFLSGADAQIPSASVVGSSDDNEIACFIDYRPAYAAIAAEIELTTGSDHFIYIVDWQLDLDVKVDAKAGRIPISTLLEQASRRGVAIRVLAMFNNGLFPPVNNTPAANAINKLPTGGAILDSRYLLVGTHHQKFVVLKNSTGLVGFCGGMDIADGRMGWDSGNPAPVPTDGPPWHDVSCRIRGSAARDLFDTFCNRWNDHPWRRWIPKVQNQAVTTERPSPATPAASSAKLSAQVVRTYGNGTSHLGLAIPMIDPFQALGPTTDLLALGRTAPRAPSRYQFAPQGEMTIYKLLTNAIAQASKFIYMEDQYLVASEDMHGGQAMCKALAAKVAESSFQQLVILVTAVAGVQGELFQTWTRRAKFLAAFGQAASKVAICQYRGNVWPPYVHSKTWIIDDEFVVFGSANCNRRGYSHDSELGIGITDGRSDGFAHQLRVDLWHKHLNWNVTPPPPSTPSSGPRVAGPIATRPDAFSKSSLDDFATGAKHWFAPEGTPLEKYDPNPAKKEPPDQQLPTKNLDVLAKRYALELGFVSPLMTNMGTARLDWEWNHLIDPDGS